LHYNQKISNFADIFTMNKDYVTHSGIITRIDDGSLTLRTEEACRCEGCAVASLCNKDSSSEQESITINTTESSLSKVGERVEVIASSGSTLRLIWHNSGAWSLVTGFVVLAIYDLFLYRFRKRLAQNISWKVRRL